MKFLSAIYISLFSFSLFAQTVVPMEKIGGVYKMPCSVNGLKLNFIFDTGASDVSISSTEALFMIKNGYLKSGDIGEKVSYTIANGDIEEGVLLNLREVKIGNIVLENVQASVSHSINAPLLLGQSVLNKLHAIQFNYSTNTLTCYSKSDFELLQSKLSLYSDYQEFSESDEKTDPFQMKLKIDDLNNRIQSLETTVAHLKSKNEHLIQQKENAENHRDFVQNQLDECLGNSRRK